MSDTFGLRIGLEGEKEFRNALREINQNFKVLQSEMNLVSSAFDKNDQSVQAVAARNSVLNKEIDTQKDKISTLEKALSSATASFGENDKRTQAWVIQLNNAKAQLNGMERELASNNKALAESNSSKAAAEKADKDFAAAVKDIEASFKTLGSEMALVSSQFDKHDKSAQALASKNTVLNKEIELQKEKIESLGKAMNNSAAAFGESDKRTQAWVEKLNNAKAELNGMERELSNNEKAIQDVSRGYNDAGKKLDEYGREIEDATEKTSIFADVLKANLASAAIQAGFGALVNMVKEVGVAVKDYISDGSQMAKDAAENHAKLEQVMRNTMDASDAEIQSIVELTKAQEQLGVVSHTTQLGGAQELGTYLEKSDTLKTLIPVMNDMVVQQYGINASQESAVNIGTMLGKVMNGQVGALSRYGYTFDEVQENILKFGTEAERAAVLAEVVGESVGGMNEAMAATDLGKMSSLNTILDNTKIKVGEVANGLEAQILGRMFPSIESLSGAFLGVVTGEGSVEDMAAAFTDVFTEIEGIIQDFLPVVLELGGNILTAVVTGIVDNLDIITDALLNLIEMLVETISELLPLVVEAGISLIFALLDGIIQALPTLIDAALEAVVTLANGIAAALPELIPVIIETIIFIVENLLNNLDSLLDAALAIIMGLADGLTILGAGTASLWNRWM
jgi:predicted  nucleic acid-binding Zn-ribbon protein